ncbi:MAG: ester cyclase [Candidatus Dadabacteria bacterium]|nr:ester cyclase [Candidatus Dadabacteria bacterium]
MHHATVTGTHKGDFMGHAATDKKATWKEIHILQFEDGKAVAHWGLVDMMGLMMQLGVMPQPEMTKK